MLAAHTRIINAEKGVLQQVDRLGFGAFHLATNTYMHHIHSY